MHGYEGSEDEVELAHASYVARKQVFSDLLTAIALKDFSYFRPSRIH